MRLPKSKTTGRKPSSRARVPLTYYRSAPPTDKPSPFEAKPLVSNSAKRKIAVGAVDIVLIIAIVGALFSSLIVRSSPNIVLNSQTYHPEATYYAFISGKLQDFKNHNKITLDEQGIVAAVQAKFPEISSVSVELPLFGQKPTFRLAISPPELLLKNSGLTYVVDGDGTAVGQAKDLPQAKKLIGVDDQSGFQGADGQRVLSAQAVSFISQVVAQCNHANVPIASLVLPPLAQELDLRTSDHSYYVKFYLGGDVLQQTGQFLAARHNFSQTGKQPSQYLDVRVPGKIYYK